MITEKQYFTEKVYTREDMRKEVKFHTGFYIHMIERINLKINELKQEIKDLKDETDERYIGLYQGKKYNYITKKFV